MKKRDNPVLYLILIVILVFMLVKRSPFVGQFSLERTQLESSLDETQQVIPDRSMLGTTTEFCNTRLIRAPPQGDVGEILKLSYSPLRAQSTGSGALLAYSTGVNSPLKIAGIFVSDPNGFLLTDSGTNFYQNSGAYYSHTKVTADDQGEAMAYVAAKDPNHPEQGPIFLRVIVGGIDGLLNTGAERVTNVNYPALKGLSV